MYVEVALMLGGVRAVRTFKVHVVRVPPRLQRTFALVGVLHVVLQILLSAERSFTELTLQVVLVNGLAHLAFQVDAVADQVRIQSPNRATGCTQSMNVNLLLANMHLTKHRIK